MDTLLRVSEIVVAAIFAVIAGVNIIETILYGQYHALIIALPSLIMAITLASLTIKEIKDERNVRQKDN